MGVEVSLSPKPRTRQRRLNPESTEKTNLGAPRKDVLLRPNGKAVLPDVTILGSESSRRRNLSVAIRQRIEVRLGDRIRNLAVRVQDDNSILLEGTCATYYSKQLAQHAALGVIEDEHLENCIIVRTQS